MTEPDAASRLQNDLGFSFRLAYKPYQTGERMQHLPQMHEASGRIRPATPEEELMWKALESLTAAADPLPPSRMRKAKA